MDKWTIGISERLKNVALTRVFKNGLSLVVVENDINMFNLFLKIILKHALKRLWLG